MSNTTKVAGRAWLVWMWQHYSLSVEAFDTRDAAMEWAEYTEDHGEGSLMVVEGPTGEVTPEEWAEWSKPRRAAEEARRRAEKPRPHLVWVLAPREEAWSPVGWHESLEDAEADATTWAERLGAHRVRVETLPKRPS